MLIKTISLQNFRSFTKASFSFSSGTMVIIGPNTSGKTNILEAIYLLATGKSWRVGVEEEMINANREFARIKGWVVGRGSGSGGELEVVLTRGVVGGQKVGRKKLSVNKLPKRLVDYQGNLRVVLFGPWDMDLISGSPTTRRKFIDSVLSQVDREYRRALLSYEKGLRQRNKVLERIREEGASRSQLVFWDRLLIKNGNYLSQKRQEFVSFVNATPPLEDQQFLLEYDISIISESRLLQYAQVEIAAGATLVGPHRDDIRFKLKVQSEKLKVDRDLAIYGSRGEQRMCILWLKLAELAFISGESKKQAPLMEEAIGEKPILLLDDIFSELDHRHREVVSGIVGHQQTILTTTDPHMIEDWKKKAEIINLS